MTHSNRNRRASADRTRTGLLFLVVLVIFLGTMALMLRTSDPKELIQPNSPRRASSPPGPFDGASSPALSPDGSRVAIVRTNAKSGHTGIFAVRLEDGVESLLVDEEGDESRPAWSPTSDRLAFARVLDGTLQIVIRNLGSQREAEAWSVAIPGRIDPRTAPGITWRPDGEAIVFPARQPDGTVGLTMYDTETAALSSLTRPPEARMTDLDPSFSPGGDAIAFTRYLSPSDSDLFVIGASDDVRQLTFDHRNVFGHAWSPDGKRIVFGSNRGGVVELWSIPASGGAPEPLSYGIGSSWPTIARNGSIAFDRWTIDTAIRVGSVDGNARPDALVFATDQWEGAARFSRNGVKGVFVRMRREGSEIRTAPLATLADSLVFSSPSVLDAPSWSPDLSAIAFQQKVDGRMEIIQVDADGQNPRAVTGGEGESVFPAWSRDGSSIFFGSNRTGTWEIWRVGPEGGIAEQVTRGGGYRALVAPDGRFLFSRRYRPGIWELLPGGDERLITERLSWQDAANWCVTDEGVWFVVRDPARGALLIRHEWDGTETELREIDPVPLSHYAAMDVSLDGQSILWTSLEKARSSVEIRYRGE